MDPIVASKIVALRPALESLVVRAAKDPDQILSDMTPVDRKVVQTIRRLCELHAGSYEIQRSTQSAASSGEYFPRQGHTLGAAGFGGPPPNRGRFGGRGGGFNFTSNNRGGFNNNRGRGHNNFQSGGFNNRRGQRGYY